MDFLENRVAADRLAHSLLLAGPEGVGKRSLALAFTAWLFCEQRTGTDACGECDSCRQLAAGSHPDFMMVSLPAGKKEIGVDRAREVKRFVQMRPLRSPFKVVVVDDAHLLNIAAQNALLKTLEEPPHRCLILLVTSRPDALLSTVRSRCQRIRFSPVPDEMLQDILQARKIDSDTASRLAALAEGSLARALSLYDGSLLEKRQEIEELLAGLGGARYLALMRLAEVLGRPEAQLPAKLELVLAYYHQEALRHLHEHRLRSRALRCAQAVREACDALRRHNPNRQLLIDALLLRLASV